MLLLNLQLINLNISDNALAIFIQMSCGEDLLVSVVQLSRSAI